ncbi:MAG: M23 family metallopeptidase [Clostridia bacterium]|nr:M23 family metallopeptidase [Clostridia bacterium]
MKKTARKKLESFKMQAIALILITAVIISGGCSSHAKKHTMGKEKHIEVLDTTASDATQEEYPPYKSALEDGFLSEYIIINTYTMKLGYSNAENFILTRMRYVQKAKLLYELLPAAFEHVYSYVQGVYPNSVITHNEDINYPNWQYLAATMVYADDERAFLYDLLGIEISVDEKEENGVSKVTVNITMHPAPIQEFAKTHADAASPEEAANMYNDIRYTYAYLTSLYDENGDYSALPYEQQITPAPTDDAASSDFPAPTATYYGFDIAYESKLVFPLDTVPAFRDTWAQGRSNNTRQHTGTDIINPEGSNIYSCSDGEVLFIGTDKIPGNYVIILDSCGFEYHYYHLCELPTEISEGDKVQPGDLIGHVGNTGNSDVSHLHVAIIDPHGVFINPYGLMHKLAEKAK